MRTHAYENRLAFARCFLPLGSLFLFSPPTLADSGSPTTTIEGDETHDAIVPSEKPRTGIHANPNHGAPAPAPAAYSEPSSYSTPAEDYRPSADSSYPGPYFSPPEPVRAPPVWVPQALPTEANLDSSSEPDLSFQHGEAPHLLSVDIGLAGAFSSIHFSPGGAGSAENGKAGLLLGALYLYYPTNRLGVGIDYEHFNRRRADSASLLPMADSSVSGTSELFFGVLKYALVSNGLSRPYVLLGAGFNRTSTRVEATPAVGFSWTDTDTWETRRLVDNTQSGFAATARLGMDFNYSGPTVFSLELGWTGIFNPAVDATDQGRDLGLGGISGRLQGLMLACRWSWRF